MAAVTKSATAKVIISSMDYTLFKHQICQTARDLVAFITTSPVVTIISIVYDTASNQYVVFYT